MITTTNLQPRGVKVMTRNWKRGLDVSDGAIFLTFFTVPVFGHIFIADPHAPAKLPSLQKSF